MSASKRSRLSFRGSTFANRRRTRHIVQMFRRRTLLLSAAALLPLGLTARAAPGVARSAQDQADIGRIEAYLNGLKTLKAHFMQVAQDGGLSEGTAWIERPGRMRFQYDPPAPFLLTASHGVLTYNDSS